MKGFDMRNSKEQMFYAMCKFFSSVILPAPPLRGSSRGPGNELSLRVKDLACTEDSSSPKTRRLRMTLRSKNLHITLFCKNSLLRVSVLLSLCCCVGCARLVETAKVIWGSSTRALEAARSEAITKSFRCRVSECFDAVIQLTKVELQTPIEQSAIAKMAEESKAEAAKKEKEQARIPETVEKTATWDAVVKPKALDLFISDPKRQLIVLMGVPGSEKATEVGVFFTAMKEQEIKIEISSLSLPAQKTASDMIFAELAMHYEEVK